MCCVEGSLSDSAWFFRKMDHLRSLTASVFGRYTVADKQTARYIFWFHYRAAALYWDYKKPQNFSPSNAFQQVAFPFHESKPCCLLLLKHGMKAAQPSWQVQGFNTRGCNVIQRQLIPVAVTKLVLGQKKYISIGWSSVAPSTVVSRAWRMTFVSTSSWSLCRWLMSLCDAWHCTPHVTTTCFISILALSFTLWRGRQSVPTWS